MAVRWSNPSGPLGIQRFRVWPDDSDQYSYVDFSQNWEKIDAIIGAPKSSTEQWPQTTGVDGGIYAEINQLQQTALPIGTVIAWYKSSETTPLPEGFELCDGRSIPTAQHDFGTGAPVTLPDMRNAFVLGADPTKSIGTAGVAVTHANIDNAAGAPGPQGTGGTNAVTLTTAQMPSHNHSSSKTGWSALSLHWFAPPDGEVVAASGRAPVTNATSTGVGGWYSGKHRHKVNNIPAEGEGKAHENRPPYVGLVWIMKVRSIK
ncbi:MAG: hypothetical protein QXU32_01585 [Nitrososphaerales archaeon]